VIQSKNALVTTIVFFLLYQPSKVIAEADGPDCWQVINVPSIDTLSVRSGPGVKYPKMANLSYDADGIQMTGLAKRVGRAYWVPIIYDGIEGWVNRGYLSEGTNCFTTQGANSHTVIRGETLSSISQHYGESVNDLARWNGLQEPYTLFLGQRLRVSPPMMGIMNVCTYHIVKVRSNDRLWIRANPGTKSGKVGAIPYDGTGIQIIGDEVKLSKSRWIPIRYKGIEGWVNRSYLETDC
jgi:uncharacterized protein YraI